MPKIIPKIMDVTLRDGGYRVGNNWPSDLIQNIVSCLNDAGIPYIEIGHGVSLGAQRVLGGSLDSKNFAEMCRPLAPRAKIGMIALPSLATLEDLREVRPNLDFLRIGSNVNEVDQAAPWVTEAKTLGYEVFFQMIRTSRVSARKAALAAKQAQSLGADVVYLVDSAGGWSPWEVKPFVEEVRAAVTCPLGFHAHNHLGSALANTLVAFEAGCEWIDASLRGLGRGAGNVPLELLVLHLKRRELLSTLDFDLLETAASQLDQAVSESKPISKEDYLPAGGKIDLYPWDFYMQIASLAGIRIESLIQALTKIPGMVEIKPEHLDRALHSLGVDPLPIFKSLGIKEPLEKDSENKSSSS